MNVNIIKEPYQSTYTYYDNGVLDGTIDVSLCPTDNPVVIGFETEPYSYSGFRRSQLYFTNNNLLGNNIVSPFVINDGDSLTLFGETFTAVASNPIQNQFFSEQSNNITLCLQSLASAINYNSNLRKRYVAQYFLANIPYLVPNTPIHYVLITSRANGSSFDFTPNYSYSLANLSLGFTPTFELNAIDLNRGEQLQNYNYGVYCEIWRYVDDVAWGKRPQGQFSEMVAVVSQKYQESNTYLFDVSKYIDAYPYYTTPDISTIYSTFNLVPDAIKAFYVVYGEQFNGGYQYNSGVNNYYPSELPNEITNFYTQKYVVGQSDVYWATNSAYKAGINPPNNAYTWDGYGTPTYTPTQILSNQPAFKKRRRTNEPEYNHFYLFNTEEISASRLIRLKSVYTTVSGTVLAPILTHLTSFSTMESGLYVIDVGFGLTDLDNIETLAGETIIEFSHVVEMSVDGGATWFEYSKEYTYSIDTDTDFERAKKLYFLNKYNVLDQFDFDGYKVYELNSDTVKYRRTDTYESNERPKGKDLVQQTITETVIEMNSGYVDKATQEFLKEIIESNEWYITEDSTEEHIGFNAASKGMVKLVLTDHNWELDEYDQLYNLTLKFKVSMGENNIKK